MIFLYSEYKQRVSSALIQCLKSTKLLQVAENLIKQNDLQWSFPNSSDVYIIGPNKDVLEFAIECLECLLDTNRNPLCSLEDGQTRLVFKGNLAKNIIKAQQILKEKTPFVFVDESTYSSDVTVICDDDNYSKIRETIDEIRYSTSSSTDSSSLLDINVVEGKRKYNGYPGSPSTTPLFHFQHSKFQYSFKANNIQVYVYKASITDVTCIDAIVNAADEYLCHESGVAYAICEAAGYLVKQQCSQHVNKHGRVLIGQNCVTIPGNLKHLEAIIHAVGPRWDDYSDKKQCAMALHETIINVLRTATTHCLQKIALPPISAGIFKVPKDLCAQMYIKAIIDYSRDVTPNNVTEIHFVDIKDDILKAIRKAHENWKKPPEFLDFKNALEYAPPHGGARARTPSYSDRPMSNVMETLERISYSGRHGQGHHGSASYLPCEVQYCGTETMPFGVQQTIFKVKKRVTVRIYSGSIVKVSGVDALVCSIGSTFKRGKLAEAFELAGGEVYKKALLNLKRLSHSVGDVAVLLEPGNLRSKFVLLAITESKQKTTVDENTAQKLKDLYVKILEIASVYGMKRIALTLLCSGMLVNDATNLECCCKSLIDGLTNSQVVRGICVEDIQVVNIHPEVTDAIVRAFHQRSTRSQAKSKFEGVVSEYKSSTERMPKLKQHALPIHHTQFLKLPNDYKKGGGKKEKEKCALAYGPSSPWFSQDKDDSYYQARGNGMQWKDRNEVKQKEREKYSSSSSLSSQDEEDADNFDQSPKNSQTPVDDAKVKNRNEQLTKNTGISVTTSGEKDTEINKLEKILKDLEAKKIEMIKEKRQKELEEKIRQTEEDLRVLSVASKDIQDDVKRCLFCSDVLRNPKKLGCGHEFCGKCFYQAFEFQDGCPLCGIKVGDDDDSQHELSSDALHSWYNSSDFIENS